MQHQYQRHIAICFGFLYQILGVPNGLLIIYAIATLNYNILLPLIVICCLQYPVSKSQKFINFVNKYIKLSNYLKSFTVKHQQKIKETKKCMFCFHPHGIFSYAILLNMNSPNGQMPKFTALGSRFGFNAPFLGLILRLWGCSTVNNDNIKNLMKKGQNIGLVPGGYQQASITTPKEFRVFLKIRKGFIKYALQYNYTIYPVLTFGQQNAYETLDYLNGLKLWLNKLKIPATIFWSKYLFFLNPNTQLTTVVGRGIRNMNYKDGYVASNEDVEQYHRQYVKQVEKLYQKHKILNQNKPIVVY